MKEFHEITNIFPEMEDEEYRTLLEDIKEHGLCEPIWTYQGKIIDGRHRYRVCLELGIEPKFREWDGNGSLVDFVISLNLHRRHLTSSQRAAIAVEILPWLEKEANKRKIAALKQNQEKSILGKNRETDVEKLPHREGSNRELVLQKDNQLNKNKQPARSGQTIMESFTEQLSGKAREQAAKFTGTNPRYVSTAKKIKEKAPEVLEKVKEGRLTLPEAKKLISFPEKVRRQAIEKIENGEAKNIKDAIKKIEQQAERKTEKTLPLSASIFENCRLIHGDVANIADRIEPESVDVIITDPPYSKEYLSLYETLAKLAVHVLKPGGSLLVMTGQYYLPEVIKLMVPHINYHWTLAYLTPGGQSPQIWPRRVNTFWKPVLWFVKGKYTGKWIGDVAKSAVNDNDKRFHKWGQSESGIAELIEKFSEPGDVILDPLLGGGTTAVVALRLGRRFIGADIDKEAVNTTELRVKEVMMNAAGG